MAVLDAVLSVRGLSVAFRQDDGGVVSVVDGVSFSVQRGKTLGLVGESGCGKSVTALAVMGLLPQPYGCVTAGEVLLQGESLLALSAEERRALRGKRLAMIFQEPMSALNPVHKVGRQILEVFRLHQSGLSRSEQVDRVVSLLREVGIADPVKRLDEYPHQLSGGMRQRVMIAMALVCEPEVLIADEPTTALDVTVQAQILELIRSLQVKHDMAVLLITHNMGVVAQYCDDVAVMYAGQVVEQASVVDLFEAPLHPYTRDLLNAIPQLDGVPKVALPAIAGRVPDYRHMISGCRYHNRCRYARAACRQVVPLLESCGDGAHRVACIRWQDIKVVV